MPWRIGRYPQRGSFAHFFPFCSHIFHICLITHTLVEFLRKKACEFAGYFLVDDTGLVNYKFWCKLN